MGTPEQVAAALREFVEDVYTWGADRWELIPELDDPTDPEQWKAYLIERDRALRSAAGQALRAAGYTHAEMPQRTVDR